MALKVFFLIYYNIYLDTVESAKFGIEYNGHLYKEIKFLKLRCPN